jgi:F-type H+-transporting ATPase subunit gamma
MASLRDIKLKIKTIRNIQQITRAMKMVAAARLKRVQARLDSSRPYARKIAEVTVDLASLTSWSYHPLLRAHSKNRRVLILVFTGDRGLAGGFHQKVADGAVQFARKFEGKAEVAYYLIGNKGIHRFQVKRIPIYKMFTGMVAGITFPEMSKLAQELIQLYLNEEFDQIYLYYPKFNTAMSQRPRAFQLLPLDPSRAKKKEEHGLFIFEPGMETILETILPRYIETEVYRAFLETEVGELGARMSAMSLATENAGELISNYQLQYNRIRQSQITKEIAEIVGGAEALKG